MLAGVTTTGVDAGRPAELTGPQTAGARNQPDPEARAWLRLLPAVLDDDPGEAPVTDALLEAVDLDVELAQLVEDLADLLEAATAAATRRAYAADWADFTDWAARYRLEVLPAEPRTVALYVTAHQDRLRPATLLRRLSAIAVAHRSGGHPSPAGHELVRRAVVGLRRKHGARPAGKSALVTAPLAVICTRLHARLGAVEDLRRRIADLHDQPGAAAERRRVTASLRAARAAALRARRDRALLLLGYAAALRRSELVGLDAGDLVETEQGLQVFIARSKTDQTGLGDFVGVAHGHPTDSCAATCPIRAWTEWRDALHTELTNLGEALHPDAPAFRPITRHGTIGTPGCLDPHARLTGQSVALIVKDAVALLADPERYPPARYAGHSLRAGFATQAAAAGVPLDRIMRQTRHTSVAVALRYIRPGQIWQDNPSAALGL